ncbi:MAG: histidine kinase [Rhodocyclaceae bacterium]|nr:histidine kinase [Rhodocyclaceae bacterium]MDZ4216598.1 histidine kinase [Rhodocyclaceae bacterium]
MADAASPAPIFLEQRQRLPDFRNQGVWLRLLLAANVLMLMVALIGNRHLSQLPRELVELAALVEPALLLTLALWYLLSPRLQRLTSPWNMGVAVLLAMAAMAGVDAVLALAFHSLPSWRAPVAAGLAAALLLYWFGLRSRAQAPALAEARLSALTARIRPHFFFNSLNAVLGIMREDARRAETALEELAELFRALMRDNRELTLLSEEIALARKYLDIERLRLGDRLQVIWTVDACPPDALAPPLLLQPLLENAVYHGIEPLAEPGEIHVCITPTSAGVRIEINNPIAASREARPGNHMAMENLHERLMLFYDLEARLETRQADGRYWVRVDLPMRSAR